MRAHADEPINLEQRHVRRTCQSFSDSAAEFLEASLGDYPVITQPVASGLDNFLLTSRNIAMAAWDISAHGRIDPKAQTVLQVRLIDCLQKLQLATAGYGGLKPEMTTDDDCQIPQPYFEVELTSLSKEERLAVYGGASRDEGQMLLALRNFIYGHPDFVPHQKRQLKWFHEAMAALPYLITREFLTTPGIRLIQLAHYDRCSVLELISTDYRYRLSIDPFLFEERINTQAQRLFEGLPPDP